MFQALLADVFGIHRESTSASEKDKKLNVSLAEHKDKDVQEGTEIKGSGSPRASQRNAKVVTEEG